MKKIGILIFLLLIVIIGGWVYFNYYYSRGNGIKTGRLIQFQTEGLAFKTNEGELTQSSMRNLSNKSFRFSVTDPKIADSMNKLMLLGDNVEISVHFVKYKGALPWRGANYTQNSVEGGSTDVCAQYIVDKIENVIYFNNQQQGMFPMQGQQPMQQQQMQQPAQQQTLPQTQQQQQQQQQQLPAQQQQAVPQQQSAPTTNTVQ